MSRPVKIGLVQAANDWPGYPEPGESDAVYAFQRKLLDPYVVAAGEGGVDVICFSENAMGHGIRRSAEDRERFQAVTSGESFAWAAAHARRFGMHVIMPITGVYRDAVSNTAVIIGRDGEPIGVYCKVHITQGERERGLKAGDDWPVFELDFGRIGVMICHDMEFPESGRCLTLDGAEIIFYPTHWGNSMGDNWVFSILQGTAAVNGVYVAPVSLAPRDGEYWSGPNYIARTGLIGPQGEWRFSAGFIAGLVVGEIDLDIPTVRKWHGAGVDFRASHLRDRRSDTYGRLAKP
jgi:predicted amidohydrolase